MLGFHEQLTHHLRSKHIMETNGDQQEESSFSKQTNANYTYMLKTTSYTCIRIVCNPNCQSDARLYFGHFL